MKVNSKSIKDFVDLIIKSGKIIESVKGTADYKTNNKEFKKLYRIYEELNRDLDMAKDVYGQLLEHSCISVRVLSAVQCLKSNIYIIEAENVLEKISQQDEDRHAKFESEMCLRVWRGEISGKTL